MHTTCSESSAEEDDIQVERSRTTKPVTYYDCFMRAMETVRRMETAVERSGTTEQSTQDGLENLVPLLYGPRLPHRWAEDGTLVLRAPTQKQCESKLDFALKLIHEARYQAQKDGALTARPQPGADHRKLSDSEMDVALAWLRTISE